MLRRWSSVRIDDVGVDVADNGICYHAERMQTIARDPASRAPSSQQRFGEHALHWLTRPPKQEQTDMPADEILLPGADTELLADKPAVTEAAAEHIRAAATAAIERQGRFKLCLAGGTTPTAAYERLKDADASWRHWWIYHGDERCVPPESGERNSLAAGEAWLDHVPVPRQQIHAIPVELGAEFGALGYELIVRAALPFDLVLLGIGEDGHTASLFPGREIPEDRLAMPVYDAPKPPPERVSLTLRALANSQQVLILVTGAGKAEAVRRWRQGVDLPIAQVARAARSRVLMDRAAAGV